MKEPLEVVFDNKTYYIHEIPAVQGREILTQYIPANLPKIGDYAYSEKLMLKAMKYVSVKPSEDREIFLSNQDLINNHVSSTFTLLKLEKEVILYSFDFLAGGETLNFLKMLEEVATQKITEILMGLSAQSSTAEKPR